MIDATMTKRMEEATRLTRAGRLHEAMALLQGGVPEARREGAPNRACRGGNTFDGTWQVNDKEDTVTKPASQAPPSAGAFKAGSFSNRVGTRDYKLYIPSGYHGQALPLVVMLHGCTQNPDDFAAGTDMNRLAEEQLCCVLYPAQPTTANNSKCWNWFKAEDQQREGGEPEILTGMTRMIIDTYGLDTTRVYVAGLSAGAAMATTLAMTYPDLFAAVGVHSGLPHGVAKSLPDALGAMQGGTGPLGGGNKAKGAGWASDVPAIIFHGDRDTTVHPSNADRVAAQYTTSRQTGATVEKGKVANGHGYTCTTYHNAKSEPHLEQWRVHGAGHAWSGGNTKGSYTDPKGPDATKEMLRFFFQHRQA
ncbi:alpha/beta hydrolase family esterase [Vreelandella sp. F11]|uniref:extracellular catalytic domain type 1 short-chain-length polyhydroxyalkanoate depolymerase n=1 Tax=Vreelandella sp. F11 TaxID=3394751 RepID=UPI0036DE5133